MPSNPLMPDGGQNLSQLLMALGSGFSMASAANQPWWAGIGPAAGLYGQAQQQAEDRAYRQQQIEQNNQYRQLQEQALRAQIKAAEEDAKAAGSYVPTGAPAGFGQRPPAAQGGSLPGMAVPPKPPVMGGGQNVNIPQAATAIGKIEGDYNSVGPVANGQGNRAYGKYQVMDFNIGPWTKEVLGTAMTPEQFLADSGAQDAVFNSKFGAYANKYGPEGAARAWFAGEGGMNNPNAKDVLGTTVASYGRKFADLYGMQNPEAPPESYRGPGTNPMPRPQISIPTPPPAAPGPAPSPIVPVGGEQPFQPMQPGQTLPPMPTPPPAPQVELSPEEMTNVMVARRKGGVAAAEKLALEYLSAKRGPLQHAADQQHQAALKEWDARVKDGQWVADYNQKGFQFAEEMRLKREQEARVSRNADVGPDNRPNQPVIDAAAAKKRAESEASLDTTVATDLVKGAVDRFIKEDRPKGLAVQEVIPQIHNIRRLVEAGAITGPGTEFRNVLSQVAQTVGFKSPEATITPAYLAGLADQIVANAKALGVNPTNRDNEIIERAKGANPNNSKEAVLALLDLQEQMQRNVHRRYTDEAKRVQNMRGVKSAYGEDYFNLPEPQTYQEWLKANPLPQSATPGGAGGVKRFNPATGRIE